MTYFRVSTILALIASIAFSAVTIYRFFLIRSIENGSMKLDELSDLSTIADTIYAVFGLVLANYFLSLVLAQSKGRN